MSRFDWDAANFCAAKMREDLRVGETEPINMKTVVLQKNILTVYRPLSDNLFGLSLKSADGLNKFILVNSNSTRGRQHFTIAHELYHLYFDKNPEPHFCNNYEKKRDSSERNADMFASAFLMPAKGILSKIPNDELVSKKISIDTSIRLGQIYGVSHGTLVLRLKELGLISEEYANYLFSIKIRHEASMRGYDGALYKPGNENLVISDFGAKARELYDKEKISEGHYLELLNLIGYGKDEDSSRC